MVGLGILTVWATLLAGLLGPIAIAVYAIILSLPVWDRCPDYRPQATGQNRLTPVRISCEPARSAASHGRVAYSAVNCS